ncbi:MAG: sigma-70 family RNA polymerase sigma factor [Negativicutes bacterium]|nr:sigma-70 family RNA polymerase sigma factor [Negativicutes bacterium]
MANEKLGFEELYQEFQPRIYRYLTRLVGSDDAEDLTQEVFIKVNQALPAFRQEAQPSTWLYRIATNAAIDRTRSAAFRQKAAAGEPEAAIDMLAGQAGCTGQKPLSTEDEAVRREMNECIRRFITSLPDNYRTVVILSDLEGFKNSEIAAILGLSVDAVKIRLHRAKARLKKELAANCLFYRTDCNQLACEPKGPVT